MQINLQGQHVSLSETHNTMTRNANIYANEDYTELNRYYIEYCSDASQIFQLHIHLKTRTVIYKTWAKLH